MKKNSTALKWFVKSFSCCKKRYGILYLIHSFKENKILCILKYQRWMNTSVVTCHAGFTIFGEGSSLNIMGEAEFHDDLTK